MSVKLKDLIYKKPPKNGKYYLVAIDGRGGAGKTTLTEYLARLLPEFNFINGDGYFEPTPNSVAWGEFNDERFTEDVIVPLKQTKATIAYRPYDWHNEPPITEQVIKIGKGICIERSFIFAFDLDWDLKIWVETPSDIALERGQIRDEMPLEEGLRAWAEIWKPQEDAYINEHQPLKNSDVVIDGTKSFEKQIA